MRLRFVVVTAMVIASCALAGCGSSGSSGASHTQSASTKQASASDPAAVAASTFAAHAGLAFGTFYRLIYNPYRAGAFRTAADNHAAFARAAAAAAYVASQLDQATSAARRSAALSKGVLGPLEVLDAGFHSALTKLRAGQFKMSEIQAADLAISAIKGSATVAGVQIGESS